MDLWNISKLDEKVMIDYYYVQGVCELEGILIGTDYGFVEDDVLFNNTINQNSS